MPLVKVNKIRMQHGSVRGQGVSPKHVKALANSYVRRARSMWTPEVARGVRRALLDGDPEAAVDLFPEYIEGGTTNAIVWDNWRKKLEGTMGDLVELKAQESYRKLGIRRKPVIKAARIPVVPISPEAMRWVRSHAEKIVAEISITQLETVRAIMLGAIGRGSRSPAIERALAGVLTSTGASVASLGDLIAQMSHRDIMTILEATPGLLVREARAVARRHLSMKEIGIPAAKVNRKTIAYGRKLLRARADRISRTETIGAQSRGRLEGWQMAQMEGELPTEVKQQWVSAPESANPNRPCRICRELNGQVVGLNESFSSSFVGPVEAPPAHPSCRCNTIVVEEKREDLAARPKAFPSVDEQRRQKEARKQ